jgi:hypothetical protein
VVGALARLALVAGGAELGRARRLPWAKAAGAAGVTAWSGAFQTNSRSADYSAAAHAARLVEVAQGAPPLDHQLGGTPD